MNSKQFSEIHWRIFIIELLFLQFEAQIRYLSNKFERSQKQKEWEEEDRSKITPVKKEEKRTTDLFSVQDLPEACVDLFVRISKSNQVNIQNLLVFRFKSSSKA